ncbi:uncharacterized protein Ilp7 [Procambarus clarkii]|uniref:uncharacterized protein Ilp7 n=1 Tax=Procambarus clarkii TaxID=6728 RepID=UPI001E675D7E|nr:uncharacterized protein LOC123758110 [Procambarus clarkii]
MNFIFDMTSPKMTNLYTSLFSSPQMALLLAAMFVIAAISWALDPDLIRQIESRTEAEWQTLWSKERLALCRARLRYNLDSICGKDVYRRSLKTPPPSHHQHQKQHHLVKRTTDICVHVHEAGGESAEDNTEKREKSLDGAESILPSTTIEINPSTPDTGQESVQARSPFLSVHQANLFVTTWVGGRGRRGPQHRLRRQSPSITAECCTAVGCTWEEYAEYCPTSSRLRAGVTLI